MINFVKNKNKVRVLSLEETEEIYTKCNYRGMVEDWETFLPWTLKERTESETDIKIIFVYPKHDIDAIVRQRGQTIFVKEPWTNLWLQNIIEEDSVFYDIGANCGQYSLYSAKLGCKNVYAFEPNVRNFSYLIENVIVNDLEDVIIPMNVPVSNEVSYKSWFSNSLGGIGFSSEFHKNDTGVRIGTVQETLDNLVYTHKLPSPTILKIDVDGTDDSLIIEGGWKCIEESVKHIMIEVVNDNPNYENTKQKLFDLGFKINQELTDSVHAFREESGRGRWLEYFFER